MGMGMGIGGGDITNVHVCAIILTNCANIRTQLIKPDPHDLLTAHVLEKTKLWRQEGDSRQETRDKSETT